jgi:hypothetical protein
VHNLLEFELRRLVRVARRADVELDELLAFIRSEFAKEVTPTIPDTGSTLPGPPQAAQVVAALPGSATELEPRSAALDPAS